MAQTIPPDRTQRPDRCQSAPEGRFECSRACRRPDRLDANASANLWAARPARRLGPSNPLLNRRSERRTSIRPASPRSRRRRTRRARIDRARRPTRRRRARSREVGQRTAPREPRTHAGAGPHGQVRESYAGFSGYHGVVGTWGDACAALRACGEPALAMSKPESRVHSSPCGSPYATAEAARACARAKRRISRESPAPCLHAPMVIRELRMENRDRETDEVLQRTEVVDTQAIRAFVHIHTDLGRRIRPRCGRPC